MLIVFRVVCSVGVVGLRHHNGTSPAPPLDTHNLRLSTMLHDGWAGHQEEDMEASGQTDSHMTTPPPPFPPARSFAYRRRVDDKSIKV